MVLVVAVGFASCKGSKSGKKPLTVAQKMKIVVEKKKNKVANDEEQKRLEYQKELDKKTYYGARNTLLYLDSKLDRKNAEKIPEKTEIVISNPVFEERDIIIFNKNKGGVKTSEFMTSKEVEELTVKYDNLKAKMQSLEKKSLFDYLKVKNQLNELGPKLERKKKKLKMLEKLRVRDKKERVIAGYRVASIDKKKKTGFIKMSEVHDDLSIFIDHAYENVDYKAYKKTTYKDNPPVKVRGIYLERAAVLNSARLDKYIELAKTSDINAFVIDVKGDSGTLLFKTETGAKYMPKLNESAPIKDPKAFVKKLKDNGIYVIARVVAFKDPSYANKHIERALTYKDSGKLFKKENLTWASAYDREIWEYDISMGEEAAKVGFNEVQFDYVRFPATTKKEDKNIDFKNKLNESKVQAIQGFLKTAHQRLSKKHVYVTADIFGWMTTAGDDQNIGQHWEAMANVVDYTAPMIYPSHYSRGNYSLKVPDAQPYKCVAAAIKDAIDRNKNIETPAKLRPWIQDFTARYLAGHIEYGVKEIKAEIKALKDNGVDEYMMWNSKSSYTDNAYR